MRNGFDIRAGSIPFRLSRGDRPFEILSRAELHFEAAALFDSRLESPTVLALDAVENRQARFDRLEPAGVGIEQLGVAAQLEDHVGRFLRQQLQSRRLLGEARVELRR